MRLFRPIRFLPIAIVVFGLITYFNLGQNIEARFDLIIKGAMILDGTGSKGVEADIGVRGDKIAVIGGLRTIPAAEVIDASGKYVMPGIIDVHSHADRELETLPDAENLVRQGITSVVTGNCGGSEMPVGDFLSRLERNGVAINVAHLVGHNSVRRQVMGMSAREASEEELKEMRELVRESLEAGAFGLSTGLKYTPGVWATTEEVIELSKVVAEYGGVYTSHMRDEGLRVLDSVKESIRIGEEAGLPVQISHHKVISVDKWGASRQTLELVERAQARGVKINVDQYPYRATSTGLTVLFPAWSLEGGTEALTNRFQDSETRARIKAGIAENIVHDRGGGDPANLQIARLEWLPEWEGKNFAQVLQELGRDSTTEEAAELAIEIQEKGGARMVYHCISDEDLERIMQHPATIVATDSHVIRHGEGSPHPRNYGTFPRVLGHYVREKRLLDYPTAVAKMTSKPAEMFGINNRGQIKEGFYADLVVFSPEEIKDTATFEDPHHYPNGISAVIVNGKVEVREGSQFRLRAGQILRHQD